MAAGVKHRQPSVAADDLLPEPLTMHLPYRRVSKWRLVTGTFPEVCTGREFHRKRGGEEVGGEMGEFVFDVIVSVVPFVPDNNE